MTSVTYLIVMPCVIMPVVINAGCNYTGCHYAECDYTESCFADCHVDKCRYAVILLCCCNECFLLFVTKLIPIMPNTIMLSAIILSFTNLSILC